MNIKIVISLFVLLILGVGSGVAQNKKKGKEPEKVVVFDVSMTCENCKKRIEKNIAYEKGVTDMNVNLPEKTVEVKYKSDKTSVDKIKASIEKLGYEVSVHQND